MRRNKKFRFHLTAQFIKDNYNPCRILDVGGGKGILSFLLNQYGFESIVVDPTYQELRSKFRKDAYDKSKDRYKLKGDELKQVEHINDIFRPEMVKDFDLIVGLHAHGCMYHTIDQCAIQNKSFVLITCCVVDEPIDKPVGVNWSEFVFELANEMHTDIKSTNLDFVGNAFTIYKQ